MELRQGAFPFAENLCRRAGLWQIYGVQIRLLLGPAGSGKTYRCLAEIRAELQRSAEGPPLVFVAPKQATYQLERQLLGEGSVAGYTRLHILSFERLARFVFERLGQTLPTLLNEEGRLMVLRGLLARKRHELKLFRASARLTGFAQQLSLILREFQREKLTPAALRDLAQQVTGNPGLPPKLEDLALLLEEYLDWLTEHELQDADVLLSRACDALTQTGQSCPVLPPGPAKTQGQLFLSLVPEKAPSVQRQSPVLIQHLWLDGFADFSEQELSLLAALVPHCGGATLAFCVDEVSRTDSWLAQWSGIRRTVERCRKRFAELPDIELVREPLRRESVSSRFPHNPVLAHLELHWANPQPYADDLNGLRVKECLRVVACADPEGEATVAAREILRYVRGGGRYREVAVLVRQLEPYHMPLQRVFSRYGIPFFLDRRESVAHHPMAELTRSALRTVALGWQREDWFAALKTGLVPMREGEIDRLENEALARGWRGVTWQKVIEIPNDAELTAWVQAVQKRLLPPFKNLAQAMAECQQKPSGPHLAGALREFWSELRVDEQLETWSSAPGATASTLAGSVHATVWDQMNSWLENLELAFASEQLPLREWLPVLEAGLAGLTVGLIPPALDQVLLGAIDRSRNPDIRLAFVLGMNESVFPARPEPTPLLTEPERLALEQRNVNIGASTRQNTVRERFFAYVACTRAREKLVLTFAQRDTHQALLNPSPLLAHLKQLFPSLEFEKAAPQFDWKHSEHISEVIGPLLKLAAPDAGGPSMLPQMLERLPGFATTLKQLRHYRPSDPADSLSESLAGRLYGPVLRTSVSRMEQFAACPFRFFVHSGLRAEERQRFELDVREQGTFQHDVLAQFHEELRSESKRWRDITAKEARERIERVARRLTKDFREGLLENSEQSRFMARVLTESLQDFTETLVSWMREQYQFDPVAVELPFGEQELFPSWNIPLEQGRCLQLYGRIDRVDLYRNGGEAWCVVVDYKSSLKQLDNVLLAHGLQLQLLAYLNVVRRWPNPMSVFGSERVVPAGVFYVNLRGKYDFLQNRDDALTDTDQARKLAYRHSGRFDARALPALDARQDATQGDQFNYRRTREGRVHKGSTEAMNTREFVLLVDSVESHLKEMGNEVYAGNVQVSPFRKGNQVACDQCGYQGVCRIDPWTHKYRVLKMPQEEPSENRSP